MIVQQFLHWMETAPPSRRAAAAHWLARAYLFSDIDDEMRCEMEAAMTVVLDDPSAEVRFALADALAAGLEAPRHIMLALATDLTEIAVAVLSRSPVFIDGELVDHCRRRRGSPSDGHRLPSPAVQRRVGGHRRSRRTGDLPETGPQ